MTSGTKSTETSNERPLLDVIREIRVKLGSVAPADFKKTDGNQMRAVEAAWILADNVIFAAERGAPAADDTVKRYRWVEYTPGHEVHAQGEWVRYEDIKHRLNASETECDGSLVLRICIAYEQGVGQSGRDLTNPYRALTPESEAWNTGFQRAKPHELKAFSCVHIWSVKGPPRNPEPHQLCDNGCGLMWKDRPLQSERE